ncbi:MAG: type II asparaginase [Desulfovibrionaceae bacterium]
MRFLSKCIPIFCLILFYSTIFFSPLHASKANIYILATGGTIAGAGTSSTQTEYKAGSVLIDSLLTALPANIKEYANVKAEQIFTIGSQDMLPEYWITLAKHINTLLADKSIDGVVITHGTDTMEETALFLNLTVKSQKPVVLVGAMRSSTGLSSDGVKNLHDAILVAAEKKSANNGVMIVMNDTILSASDAMKSKTTSVDTFIGPNIGPLGYIWGDKIFFLRDNKQRHTTRSEFDIDTIKALPRVDIIYGFAGSDAAPVHSAIANRAKGIVYAGVGNGNVSTPVEKALQEASKKNAISVIRSSRINKGPTTQWAEIDDENLGFVASWWHNPQRARVILMLGLTKTQDQKALQRMMLEY